MKNKLFIYVPIAILFCVIGVYFNLQRLTPSAPKTPAVANLFARQMVEATGKPEDISHWRGKPLIVNFWATWCGPCVEEMPELNALRSELIKKDIHIIGVGIDSQDAIAKFAEKYKITYPLYVAGTDGTSLLAQFGNGAGGLPFTVLIGTDGQVKKTYLGSIKFDELRKDLSLLQP
ncbi:TlpA family protein disulfide reductase [Glaciimonas immobilis]|uniref:Thiol-disulfide isomerase/thioredoxin n=1 Tax=Glaciimonas immobilis TaxID=728004 RepID=A0A840RSX1_9BURK|nr:TlpA disulfide reductase family protein [Glaciimonas immobilis]KAF3997421.1 TlpA family protein disulfide reductase [Glaciimonas immobilis]MBB5200915.1 thiol-disulfide isomerase/thioredoxin [Glaciimonas immobilis]